jgi:RNA polymerase sigma factor (TIGR02999 family)
VSTARTRDLTTAFVDSIRLRCALNVDEILPQLYGDLRMLARQHMRRERGGHTLQTTVLVHEAYLRLRDQLGIKWEGRAHFFAIASLMIRRILVDHARARARLKRSDERLRVPLDDILDTPAARQVDLVGLDEALEQLAQHEPRKARVVHMRFFGGMTVGEVATVLDVTTRTVERDWEYARAWLFRALQEGRPRSEHAYENPTEGPP